ncbi:hypothetical protein O7635_22985 [Asanoa sp. WMMD1127]|uniref:hypothetical protein n=1 Tax=Asanoa sp. WMMD1127 TaxID=3016107 RepID=UPI002416E73E|nr:hypothetical protein [Asanoa sp. WMMD1127]MDG4824727.1 hypothetical protein [Asanoa sp. WMMD1127]
MRRFAYLAATYGAPAAAVAVLAAWWVGWISWETSGLLGSAALAAGTLYRAHTAEQQEPD